MSSWAQSRAPQRRRHLVAGAAAGFLLLGTATSWALSSARPTLFVSAIQRPAAATTDSATTAAAASAAASALALGSAASATRQIGPAAGTFLVRAGSAAAVATAALLAISQKPHRVAMAAAAAPVGCIEEGATDPSLFVQTNVRLGDKKMDFMQAASKAVAKCLGKPESYVAVCVQEGQDIIWGGSDAPCALCKVISLGSINLENNKALTKEVSALLAEFEVPANRIYVNFFDLERQNVGYNGATFAG
eukprot:gb/GFBE01055094.1/.p1 GENE.gb/GFBE01055094.1/~~gb/GFBE01055094.1/.p1  ORF type:complete len:248 (+),score=52.11 gb/GFBE01055094.1/:1-744(+)